MEQTKHTPGPWKWSMSGTFDKSRVLAPTGQGDEHVTIATTDLTHIHAAFAMTGESVPDGFTHANEEANARLIAAAPDLLAALQWAMDNAEWSNDTATGTDPIRAAIAKATGQQ
jgi:hypothetical protein